MARTPSGSPSVSPTCLRRRETLTLTSPSSIRTIHEYCIFPVSAPSSPAPHHRPCNNQNSPTLKPRPIHPSVYSTLPRSPGLSSSGPKPSSSPCVLASQVLVLLQRRVAAHSARARRPLHPSIPSPPQIARSSAKAEPGADEACRLFRKRYTPGCFSRPARCVPASARPSPSRARVPSGLRAFSGCIADAGPRCRHRAASQSDRRLARCRGVRSAGAASRGGRWVH
ncbi:hypothetical protein FKP32DRAFT_649281 [Trametes sanguinea]|nr:hypothetical protein FKP32DRAFT_649281 [Trametes sanguinea]